MRNLGLCRTLFGVAALVGISGTTALAKMHNPGTYPWPDRSKPIDHGVDISPQHFASVVITPKGNGQFEAHWTCQNGMRGSRNDGRYKVEFMQGETVLGEDTQDCHLGRSDVQFAQLRHGQPIHRLDLSRIVDSITSIRMSVTPLDAPPRDWKSPGAGPPLRVVIPPLCIDENFRVRHPQFCY